MAECRIPFVNVMCINQNCFEQCPKGLNWATMEIKMITLNLYFFCLFNAFNPISANIY